MVSKRFVFAFAMCGVFSGCGGGDGSPTTPTPASNPTPPPATTVSLSGTVSESGAGRVAGASVTILDGANAGRSTSTNTNGEYRFENLTRSDANLEAGASGYHSARSGVSINGTNALSFTLTRSGPRTQFGAGQHLLNTDIAAGRYFSDPVSGCYWERQSGLGGTLGEIIANDFVGFNALQIIVDIMASDRAFETDSECGTWFNTPRHGAQADIRPGTWLVGAQLSPGTYRANTTSGCYWERLRHFQGTLGGIIANDFVSSAGQQLVEIRNGDAGFNSDDDCGTWTRVQTLTGTEQVVLPSQTRAEIERRRLMNRQQSGFLGGR